MNGEGGETLQSGCVQEMQSWKPQWERGTDYLLGSQMWWLGWEGAVGYCCIPLILCPKCADNLFLSKYNPFCIFLHLPYLPWE